MEVAWYRGLMALPGRLTLGFALHLVNYVNTNVTNYWRKVHASFVLLFQRIEPSEKSDHSILSTTVSLWHYSRQSSWQHRILPLYVNGFWHWSQCIGVCETIERPSVCLSVCLSVHYSAARRLYILCWRELTRRKLSPTLATPTTLVLTTLVAQCELGSR